MHPEEKWLPGKVVKPFKPGDVGAVELEDGTVSILSRVTQTPQRKRGRDVGLHCKHSGHTFDGTLDAQTSVRPNPKHRPGAPSA